MWDGNIKDYVGISADTELSENQCGMETEGRQLSSVGEKFVEREPMWDGNSRDVSLSFSRCLVEREPMWDGNYVSTNMATDTYG